MSIGNNTYFKAKQRRFKERKEKADALTQRRQQHRRKASLDELQEKL